MVLTDKGSMMTDKKPLAMEWFGQEGMNTYDVYKGEKKFGYYRFTAPPGLQIIECEAFGKVSARLNGKDLKVEKTDQNSAEGNCSYRIYLEQTSPENAEICLEVEHLPGYYHGRAFPEPLKLICGKGIIQTGDWSLTDVLKCYSGGLWYRKNISLTRKEISERYLY